MTADLAELTAALRALMEKATPGPLKLKFVPCTEDDAALIVAAVNALPRLLAAAEDAERLRKALEPFVAFADQVEGRYRKRGGNPDSFPDSHPFARVEAHELVSGVWRRARAALSPATEPPVKDWTT